MQPATLHPRFEFKYRISLPQTTAIRDIAAVRLRPDKFSRQGSYTVNSLYFDTPDDADAHETDEGIGLRSKVRLRCYHTAPRGPFFLELKQRFGSSVYKTRIELPRADAERVICGSAPIAAYSHQSDGVALDKIREVIDRRCMAPRVWVKYRRQAWSSPWGDGARMTIDRQLEAQPAELSAPLAPGPCGWSFAELDHRPMLELKFFGAAPAWMQQVAESLELDRTSCSKYGKCLDAILGPSAALDWEAA